MRNKVVKRVPLHDFGVGLSDSDDGSPYAGLFAPSLVICVFLIGLLDILNYRGWGRNQALFLLDGLQGSQVMLMFDLINIFENRGQEYAAGYELHSNHSNHEERRLESSDLSQKVKYGKYLPLIGVVL